MKKILLILLFYPVLTYSQPQITKVAIAGTFSTTGIGGLNFTKNAGLLYIIFAGTSNSAGTPATVSLSGTGQTWTEIGSAGGVVNTTAGKRIQAFRFAPTIDNGDNTSFTYTGTQDGGWCIVFSVAFCDMSGTNGENAIAQVVTATDDATIQPSITMASLRPKASVLAAWINDVNPPTGTADAPWIENTDDGYATPSTGGYALSKDGVTDNTPSWTAGALSNWAGMAIEFTVLPECPGAATITFTKKFGAVNSLGVASTSNPNMLAGKLYIVIAFISNSAGTPATISLSGTDQTWDEIGTAGGALNSTSGLRVQAFRFLPSSNNNNTITYTYTGTQDGGGIEAYEISNMSRAGTNGSGAIVQAVTNSADASTTAQVNLAAITRSKNAVICGFINNLNPFGGSAEAGWTEGDDVGYDTPTTGAYVMYRASTTDDNPRVTITSSNYAGLGIEILGACRRLRQTN